MSKSPSRRAGCSPGRAFKGPSEGDHGGPNPTTTAGTYCKHEPTTAELAPTRSSDWVAATNTMDVRQGGSNRHVAGGPSRRPVDQAGNKARHCQRVKQQGTGESKATDPDGRQGGRKRLERDGRGGEGRRGRRAHDDDASVGSRARRKESREGTVGAKPFLDGRRPGMEARKWVGDSVRSREHQGTGSIVTPVGGHRTQSVPGGKGG